MRKCSCRKYSLSDDRAQCIDGTPASYYYRRGTGAGLSKWHIHFQGGGWCYDAESCEYRSTTALGSSKDYPECFSPHELSVAYFSSNRTENPLLHNYHLVYVRYCDGGSFAGNAKQLYHVNLSLCLSLLSVSLVAIGSPASIGENVTLSWEKNSSEFDGRSLDSARNENSD
jgi:hypothetical protein